MSHTVDLTGAKFGDLVVIARMGSNERGRAQWYCACACGNPVTVSGNKLLTANTKSCGCRRVRIPRQRVRDLTGFVSYRLTGLRVTQYNPVKWECRCSCGKITVVSGSHLAGCRVKSCGCARRERTAKQPGEAAFNRVIGNYKRAARKRGLEWKLSDKKVRELFAGDCYYCGTAPYQAVTTPMGSLVYNGIDRTDNTRGYVDDNTVSCCGICNSAKSSKSMEEFEMWVGRVYSTFLFRRG